MLGNHAVLQAEHVESERLMMLAIFRLPRFFFNDTAPTEIYTLSLHDALPIQPAHDGIGHGCPGCPDGGGPQRPDRKSTRLNSSHVSISYAVFCLNNKTRA